MIWVILAVVAITLLITLWLVIQLNRVRATITATPTDGNVFATLRKIDNELGHLDELVGAMGPRLASVEAKIPLAISYTGIVAFDAFDNIAGNLSRSIALLNEQGDGVVISLLVANLVEGIGLATLLPVISIAEHLNSTEFIRIRFGVARAQDRTSTEHVLGNFTSEEEIMVSQSVEIAADAVETIVSQGIIEAMNRFNQKLDSTPD